MELDIQSIGKRIKKRRKELHLTQTEIKEKTGISSGNMSDIERGNRLPAATTLAQLSEILDCSIDWILTGKSPLSENLIFPDIGENVLTFSDKGDILALGLKINQSKNNISQ